MFSLIPLGRIIKKLLAQPTLLSQRIHGLIVYVAKSQMERSSSLSSPLRDDEKDPVCELILNNIPLLVQYLRSSPVCS